MKSHLYLNLSKFDRNPDSPISDIMQKSECTFDEAFWDWFKKSGTRYEVIERYVYSFDILNDGEKPVGKHRFILKTRPLETLHIHRIFRIGKAPSGMNDTASVISKGSHSYFLQRISMRCRMKGCFDRYRCALYNIDEETDPWNDIPEDWVTGNEKCESFVKIIE